MPLFFFPSVASEAQTLLPGKSKSVFFLRGELDTKQPLDCGGSPSLPALPAARCGPEWKADAVQKPLQSFAALEEMSRSICVPSVEKPERFS